ncbi:MAG: hypothetical protein OXR67_07950 [Chloroflexota bacterium]|nr:hypothetical protein [Chloroflexota bacterium]
MTVDELIRALQELDRPDLEVFVPCPHCCGQRGTDFDRLDAEYCLTMVREGRTVAVLGDPREECLEDRRSDSRRDVGLAIGKNPEGIALALGLEPVRRLYQKDLESLAGLLTDRPLNRTIFHRLLRANLLLEIRSGESTEYVVAISPYRTTVEDMEELHNFGDLMSQLTGGPVRLVMASVAADRRVLELMEAEGVRHCQVSPEDVDQVREEKRKRRQEEMRLWREKRAGAVDSGDQVPERAAGGGPEAGT